MPRYFKPIMTALLSLLIPCAALAVTEKEMEEAKTIAAKNYLRYANNGSGYLDEVKASTMSQLTSQLKTKEKENLKAFLDVKTPTDFASWDKAKLVEYWSVTFFKAPGLNEEGLKSRTRTKTQISKMTIAPPSSKETAQPATEEPKKEEPAPKKDEGAVSLVDSADNTPSAVNAEVPAETKADEADPFLKEKEKKHSSSSSTWVYIMVLAILVGIVVWLIFYASRSMKPQNSLKGKPEDEEDDDYEKDDEKDSSYAPKGISKSTLALQETADRLRKENEDLRRNVGNLQAEVAALNRRLQRVETERDNALSTLETINRQAAQAKAYGPKEEAQPTAPAASEDKEPVARTFYLGRVNEEGVFVRADREYNPEGSIYKFVTLDGVSGSFSVVRKAEAYDLIATNPKRYLGNGCTGTPLEEVEEIDSIKTVAPGTAVLDNRRWKMVRKARISIEP